MDLLDKPICLRLNRAWQAIGISTVKDALVAMNSGDDFLKAASGISVDYTMNSDGSWDFNTPNFSPVSWEEWIKLPIRPFDDVVHSSRLTIRVPTVIIAMNFSKMPKIQKRPTKQNIRERDKSICQISGKVLAKNQGNIDHIIPRCRGGRDSWQNLIWIDKKLNAIKGDKTLDEIGWRLLNTPTAPKELPLSATIRNLKHRDWRFFLESI